MCASTHTFKVQAFYKSALAFTFRLCRDFKSNGEISLVDKLGSSPLSLILPYSLSTMSHVCPAFQHTKSQSLKPLTAVSFLRSPFCLFGWSPVCPNQYCRLRQLWCLFANDPYCFQQSCGRGAFPWSSKSGQFPLMAASAELQRQRIVRGGGNGTNPKLKCHRRCLRTSATNTPR